MKILPVLVSCLWAYATMKQQIYFQASIIFHCKIPYYIYI